MRGAYSTGARDGKRESGTVVYAPYIYVHSGYTKSGVLRGEISADACLMQGNCHYMYPSA